MRQPPGPRLLQYRNINRQPETQYCYNAGQFAAMLVVLSFIEFNVQVKMK